MAYTNWSTTAANNNSPAPDGFPEGMAASDVNNSARQLMADLAALRDDIESGALFDSALDLSGATLTLAAGVIDTAELADDAVTTAKVDDDAITLAKMAGGTDGNLITYDANGDPAYVATGTAGQVLKSNGAGAAPTMQDNDADGVPYDNATSGLTATDVQGAIDEVVQGGTISDPDVQTTTGSETELIFNIPAWATEIIITITGLDRSNTDPYVIQLRDADGTEASGYLGTWGRIAVAGVTSGIHGNYFQISGPEANTAVMSGDVRLTHHTGTTWVMSSSLSQEGSPAGTTASGRKSLSAALTGVRLTTSAGAATFDSGGVVAVRYR